MMWECALLRWKPGMACSVAEGVARLARRSQPYAPQDYPEPVCLLCSCGGEQHAYRSRNIEGCGWSPSSTVEKKNSRKFCIFRRNGCVWACIRDWCDPFMHCDAPASTSINVTPVAHVRHQRRCLAEVVLRLLERPMGSTPHLNQGHNTQADRPNAQRGLAQT
jgi:hypothetical protein